MHIEGPIQDFIELETIYLGTLTARTSQANGLSDPDLSVVAERASRIRELLPE
jgi:nicotinate phosphoribosyltransferase